ncbi:hypothetical protein JCM8097_000246 [Rhodosporidiobolus ruineniae]
MSHSAPPAYAPSTPPAGLRVPCSTQAAFPSTSTTGPAPFQDCDGAPVYVASALVGTNAVHPCKYVAGRNECMISYGGAEKRHEGRFDVLPITPEMEWVEASYGQIPKGRRPVEGGFEEGGQHLFHAVTVLNGVNVPGKTGEHLHGANFPFGGGETIKAVDYRILCWR